ncbi:MAG: nucleoside deaminase [Alphaproteobacteria bacterium]|nr:nucleoside deaminase [Alphaproteobacteria bacterium]
MKKNLAAGLSRRRLFLAAGTFAAAFIQVRAPVVHATSGSDDFVQPDRATPEAYIERAFELRRQAVDRGDQAYGAAVVKDGKIIGQSQSLVVLDGDPTAHAEMSAIRDAARRVGRSGLRGATLYSSSRPCPMCEVAAFWAGIDGFHFGRGIEAGGAPRLCG